MARCLALGKGRSPRGRRSPLSRAKRTAGKVDLRVAEELLRHRARGRFGKGRSPCGRRSLRRDAADRRRAGPISARAEEPLGRVWYGIGRGRSPRGRSRRVEDLTLPAGRLRAGGGPRAHSLAEWDVGRSPRGRSQDDDTIRHDRGRSRAGGGAKPESLDMLAEQVDLRAGGGPRLRQEHAYLWGRSPRGRRSREADTVDVAGSRSPRGRSRGVVEGLVGLGSSRAGGGARAVTASARSLRVDLRAAEEPRPRHYGRVGGRSPRGRRVLIVAGACEQAGRSISARAEEPARRRPARQGGSISAGGGHGRRFFTTATRVDSARAERLRPCSDRAG